MSASATVARNAAVLESVFGDRFRRDFDVRFWDGTTLPSITAERRFTFVLNEPGALRAAFAPPFELHAGEAFVTGAIEIEGDLVAAVRAFEQASDRPSLVERARIALMLARLPRDGHAHAPQAKLHGATHTRERDRAAIAFHYDQPVAFYESFLDPALVYSCAYYDDGVADLATAQQAKLEHVLRKLRLESGMTLLDIGCGWGALVIAAAKRGARALGITLSRIQHEEANRRIEALSLGDRARVELLDYRDLGERRFDRIASIGMVEHVGREKLPEYFRAAFAALRPGGLFLNHGITEQSPGRIGPSNPFIRRHVFPDGDLVAIGDTLAIAERSGFEVRDVENLREHYARTLRAWVVNLEANADAAIAAAGMAAFRTWRLYMAASAVSFEGSSIGLHQSLLARPDADGRVMIPATRRDLYR
ncbi:MAG: class I SAM-dependent methyltransferase [bacterium]|nr:class I SAM-dependent methyltransferase [bacterium]